MAEPGEERISRGDLREAALAGARWVTIGRAIAEISALAATVVVARLVPPAAFGLAAVAFAVNLLAQILATGGIVTALVQRKAVTQDHFAVATLFTLVMGPLLTAAVWGAAELLQPVVDDEALWLVKLASLSFLFIGCNPVAQSVLQRRLDFRRLSVIEVVALLGGTLTTVALALAGLDGEALILGVLATTLITSVGLLAAVPPVRPRWNRDAASELASTAVPAGVAALSYQGFRNIDYVIVGAQLGAAQAGFYWRAFQLGVEYQKKATIIMARLALPIYSRTEDVAHMRAVRERIVRVQATALFPFLAAFIAIAPTLIPFVYGERWEPAVVPSQILAGAGMVVVLSTGMGPLVMAAGYARALAWWNLALLLVYGATVFVAAALGGVVTVCAAVTGFYVFQLLAFHYFLLQRLVGIPWRSVFDDAVPAIVGSAVLLLTAVSLAALLRSQGAPVPIVGVVSTVFGAAAYLTIVRMGFPKAWKDLLLIVPSRRATPPDLPVGRSAG